MGASEECAVLRMKREECLRTKHDSDFSKWKILVGPSDWEDYSLGKEGAARYRVDNLPTSFGPGLYELGIAVSHTSLGREVGKLDPHRIVVVYLGQAEIVRTRLQSYGRSGAHLRNGPDLFKEIFSKDYSVVFRWAPMENKRDAEKTEARLLNTFDYAWNKGSNGPRRPNDVLQTLDKLSLSTTWFPKVARKLQTIRQKRVGIRIEARKLHAQQNVSSACTEEESSSFLPQVFKFGRSRPMLISAKSQVGYQDCMPTCGVNFDDGTHCKRPPVPGKKRCEEHKGRRVSGIISKSMTDRKSGYLHDVVLDSTSHNDQENITCGVDLGNGFHCRKQPVARRKRCEEHRGMRINGLVSKLATEDKSRASAYMGSQFSTSNDWKYDSTSSEPIKYGRSQSQIVSYRSDTTNDFSTTCGATNQDGSSCRRQPAEGGKRCWQHKGMRGDGSFSSFDTGSSPVYRNAIYNDYSTTCGATNQDGSSCRRQPAEGGKRCWQHKGMWGNSSFSSFDTGSSLGYRNAIYSDFSSTCGAPTRNGYPCSRRTVGGRRCWQH